jgi:hypothetical protein
MVEKRNKYLLIWFLSLAVILGPAYTLFDNYNYDFDLNPDLKTYLGLSEFDFDQSPVRRYRVIVPFTAAGVHFLLSPVLDKVQPWTFPGPDFSLGFSFLLVNSSIMALAGLLIYLLCRDMGGSVLGSTIGLLSFLTCRWTAYASGLPMVDSLYLLVIAMVLYSIQTKTHWMAIAAILIGPWSKESFLFIAPLLFFFGPIGKGKQVGWFLLSGMLVFAFRYLFDISNGFAFEESIAKDMSHFEEVKNSVSRLFSFHGAYEVFSIIGLWGVSFLLLIKKEIRQYLHQSTPAFFYFFLGIVFLHAMLSYDLARMFYLAIPVLAVWYSLLFDAGKKWFIIPHNNE